MYTGKENERLFIFIPSGASVKTILYRRDDVSIFVNDCCFEKIHLEFLVETSYFWSYFFLTSI